jgi:plasmid stability protein
MSALQVKNFPEDLHAKLRRRAARKGRSVSSYVLDVLTDDLERPDWDEWFATLDTREPVDSVTHEDVLAAIDEGRNEREEQMIDALLDHRR